MTRYPDVPVSTMASELAEMTRLAEDEDHVEVARRFADHLVRTVSGCDSAFLTVSRDGGSEVAVATGPVPLMSTAEDDPIGEVLRYREPRRLGDTTEDRRWPLFASRLAAQNHRSCLVLPLPTQRAPAAAMTLLSRDPHRFNDHSYDVILLIALHAGISLDNIEVLHHSKLMVDHLTEALSTRHTIGLAQGLLMRHVSCDTDGSFALLRAASQRANRKLRDIAADLVEAHENDRFHEALDRHGVAGGVPPEPGAVRS